ncbi:MAG: hypothetical protein AAF202_13025, partial [Pseudomonadota bacterium]
MRYSLLEKFLKIATVGSLLLVCWVISLWSHPKRVCWEDPKLAAVHFEGADGYRLTVPMCTPMSYLLQPDFSEEDILKISNSLDTFSRVQGLSETLKIPNRQRFHLVISHDENDRLATRLFQTIFSRG